MSLGRSWADYFQVRLSQPETRLPVIWTGYSICGRVIFFYFFLKAFLVSFEGFIKICMGFFNIWATKVAQYSTIGLKKMFLGLQIT